MIRIFSAVCACLCACSSIGWAEIAYDAVVVAEHRLEVDRLEMGWSHLFGQLRAVGNIEASFVEARFFKFRREPKIYAGEFRKSADGSVSLAYLDESNPVVVHVGESYALYRTGEEAPREIPRVSSRRDALMLFPLLLDMRVDALAEMYDLYGAFQGDGAWTIVLMEKEDAATEVDYKRIGLRGVGGSVCELALEKTDKQCVHIHFSEILFPAEFDDATRARYFFKP